MDAAYIKLYDLLEKNFGFKRRYFVIEHRLVGYAGDPMDRTIVWRVYVDGYNWHEAPTFEEAISKLGEEMFPSQCGCIGVGV